MFERPKVRNREFTRPRMAGRDGNLQYQGEQKEIFLDALICDDEKHCAALKRSGGAEKFVVFDQYGWRALDGTPAPRICLRLYRRKARSPQAIRRSASTKRTSTLERAGPSGAPFSRSHDFGRTWTASETPIISGKRVIGNFFDLLRREDHLSRSAGDYQDPARAYKNAAVLQGIGGKTWELATQLPGGLSIGGSGDTTADM